MSPSSNTVFIAVWHRLTQDHPEVVERNGQGMAPAQITHGLITSVFGEAADRFPSTFGAFALHPIYGDSNVSSECLSAALLGELLSSWGPGFLLYPRPHVSGPWGQQHLNSLSAEDRQAVAWVAAQLWERSQRT